MPLATVDPARYTQQLTEKAGRLSRLFSPFRVPATDVFPSPPSHYRMRAEFRLWHTADDCFYAMTGDDGAVMRIDSFPVACEQINTLMPQLLAHLRSDELLRRKLFQVEFLAATSGDTVITLAYHRRLDHHWQQRATALQHALGCALIGRSRGQKLVLQQDYVDEQFTVNGERFIQRQPESAFSQPNAAVNQSMVQWAVNACQGLGGDLLELYCGNGNFTLPLSRHFNKVLATEVAKASVHALQHNIATNRCSNIAHARLSSEELTQALNGVRPFRRLAHIALDTYDFSTALVDPPRAGLDGDTLRLIQQCRNIVYISCNPESLVANLHGLCETHDIMRTALFDQFPYTPHIESGVLLRKRPG